MNSEEGKKRLTGSLTPLSLSSLAAWERDTEREREEERGSLGPRAAPPRLNLPPRAQDTRGLQSRVSCLLVAIPFTRVWRHCGVGASTQGGLGDEEGHGGAA